MKRVVLKDGIDWVGYVDWTVRDFHGYETVSGSSYNAYLVRGDKIALIDAVKAPFGGDLLENVARLTDLARVDYVVCNHAEPDHAGALPQVMQALPQAELVCNAKCRDALARHFDVSAWKFRIVKSGDTLALGGGHTLSFIDTPMVHWPESMATFATEAQVLFSMDAFGQHYASSGRFDDEEPLPVVMAEAKTYFANIVMLYGKPIARVMEQLKGLPVAMVAPSHGVIWRSHVADILAAYGRWVKHAPAAKVLIVYDSMWKSTELMAQAVFEGAAEMKVDVRLHHVRVSGLTVLATEMLDAAAVAVGSPTLNSTMMPQIAAFFTYMEGLRPAGKSFMAFGSYGWNRGGVDAVQATLQRLKLEILCEPVAAQYVPRPEDLEACRNAGRLLGKAALEKAQAAGTPKE
jgi:flavorubredoxin